MNIRHHLPEDPKKQKEVLRMLETFLKKQYVRKEEQSEDKEKRQPETTASL